MTDSQDDRHLGGWLMKRFRHVPTFARPWRWEYVMNVLLLLIAISIIGQTWYVHHADEQGRAETKRVDDQREADRKTAEAEAAAQRQCLADTIREFADVVQQRGLPTDLERQATRDLILGFIGGSDRTPEQSQALVDDYQEAINQADEIRADHPLPDYPTGLCEGADPSSSPSP